MGKKLAFSVLIICLSFAALAQNQKSMIDYDRETYQLYQAGQWKNLVAYGQKILDANIDFYYLRMRMGLAYYNLQNYEAARLHFICSSFFCSTYSQ